jgi:hypothetical protein
MLSLRLRKAVQSVSLRLHYIGLAIEISYSLGYSPTLRRLRSLIALSEQVG